MKREEGQSLIEVVIALAVAIVAILALVRATVTSIRNADFARNRALATKYAQEALEKVRSYKVEHTWQDFTDNCESIPLDSPPSPFSAPSLACSLPAEDTCEVRVTVSWTDASGLHQSELVTRLTNWK